VPHLINLMGKRGHPGASAAGALMAGARPEGLGAAIARAGDGVEGDSGGVIGKEMVICALRNRPFA